MELFSRSARDPGRRQSSGRTPALGRRAPRRARGGRTALTGWRAMSARPASQSACSTRRCGRREFIHRSGPLRSVATRRNEAAAIADALRDADGRRAFARQDGPCLALPRRMRLFALVLALTAGCSTTTSGFARSQARASCGIVWTEMRVISDRTGRRAKPRWSMPAPTGLWFETRTGDSSRSSGAPGSRGQAGWGPRRGARGNRDRRSRRDRRLLAVAQPHRRPWTARSSLQGWRAN
jgi:hypothetical protein